MPGKRSAGESDSGENLNKGIPPEKSMLIKRINVEVKPVVDNQENLKETPKITEEGDHLKNKIIEENRLHEALPSQPILDIERLAAESSKILSVLAASERVKPDSDSNTVKAIKEQGKTASLSMSSFMVFQNKFPFGTFEDDYE